jgi:hypothetical protein
MKTRNFPTALFAGLLLLGTATSVAAQTDAQVQDPHHPAETQAAPSAPTTSDDAPATAAESSAPSMPGKAPAAAAGGMDGMGMMTPEMMQMMMRMMGQGGMSGMMGGQAGQGMPEGSARSGMANEMPTAGMMRCPMMQMMSKNRGEAGSTGIVAGQGMRLGLLPGTPEEMTEDRVRALLMQELSNLGNPRLKLGQIGKASDGSITAEILTVEGSLVQKLAFNRYPGLMRQVD